jgi:hypothetical protein
LIRGARLCGGERVERARRFIEQKNGRRAEHRAGDGDALLIPRREFAEATAGEGREFQLGEQVGDARARGAIRETVETREENEILFDGQTPVETALLGGGEADLSAHRLFLADAIETPTVTVPAVGRTSVAMILVSVVLPAPLRPMRPKISPSRTSKLTSRKASTGFNALRRKNFLSCASGMG